jgi:hypothetical protein
MRSDCNRAPVATLIDVLLSQLVSNIVFCAGATAAELHPIVEVRSGYLFGAVADGKWTKADEAAKSLPDESTYRVYGLTQAFGEAKAGKAKAEDARCEQTLSVSLSLKPENGVIALAAPWNALPRKPRAGAHCALLSDLGSR